MARAPSARKGGAESAAGQSPETAVNTNTQVPAAGTAEGQQAKPEVIATAPKPDSVAAPGGDHAVAVHEDGKVAETGEASGDGHAAPASSDAAPRPSDAHPVRPYVVRSPLRHNGLRYRPDDPVANTIDLTDAEAAALAAIGVIEA